MFGQRIEVGHRSGHGRSNDIVVFFENDLGAFVAGVLILEVGSDDNQALSVGCIVMNNSAAHDRALPPPSFILADIGDHDGGSSVGRRDASMWEKAAVWVR